MDRGGGEPRRVLGRCCCCQFCCRQDLIRRSGQAVHGHLLLAAATLPSRWSCSMAWRAAARAARWRAALAWARKVELSARAIAGTLLAECREGGDDLVQAGLDAAQALGMTELAVGVGLGDETPVGLGLPPVDLQEHGRGLEVRAGEAGVGVRAVLLGRAAAVAVGEAVADPVEVVLDPLGRGGGGVGVVADPLPGDVYPLGLVAV